ncbi:alkaline ceramidase [Histoplasma capsulatum var. duboisii H88]|uniref:Alkaline ceramidase n=1 Tax=Ajellomyces capsulatus (strain H88) TaxID=544711 RepID=F0U5C7_AJEC8|nr:alkaline ceramidase [Histoplasma capsulatum var. duboisii H88]
MASASRLTRRSLGDSSPESITYTSRPINFEQKRELHGALMTILFMILFPIGSLSMHLRTKVCIAPYIHALIQTIDRIMAIMAVALGINLTSDLEFWNPLRTHVIVGLVATGIILFIQPALGIVQHHYFGIARAGYVNSRIFGVMHRWLGRVAVVLGMANSGLGFQLVGGEENVPKGSLTGETPTTLPETPRLSRTSRLIVCCSPAARFSASSKSTVIYAAASNFSISAFPGWVLGPYNFNTELVRRDPMQLVDELSMIYTTCLVCYATFSYSKPTKTRILLALFLLALAIVITLYYHYIQNPIFHQNAYALLTAIVLLRSMWVMEAALRPSWRNKGLERNQQFHSYEDMRDLKILHTMWVMVAYGLATFLGGFAIWNLDNVLCSRLRGWRRKIGLPWGHPTGRSRLVSLTGKNRHLMTGIGAYMYIVWGIWLRHCLNGLQEEYQLQWPRIYSFPDVVRVSNQGKRSTNGSTKLPAAHKPYQNGMAKKIN